ncbi:hypothetical protein LCGC14_1636200 [marine sediment metagenome]|uniref:Uncharacterized protein n=1 Tax=marine sediment metagenome TaxID=412755 RepID=A0A0F9L0L4_9ZZZZ
MNPQPPALPPDFWIMCAAVFGIALLAMIVHSITDSWKRK